MISLWKFMWPSQQLTHYVTDNQMTVKCWFSLLLWIQCFVDHVFFKHKCWHACNKLKIRYLFAEGIKSDTNFDPLTKQFEKKLQKLTLTIFPLHNNGSHQIINISFRNKRIMQMKMESKESSELELHIWCITNSFKMPSHGLVHRRWTASQYLLIINQNQMTFFIHRHQKKTEQNLYLNSWCRSRAVFLNHFLGYKPNTTIPLLWRLWHQKTTF